MKKAFTIIELLMVIAIIGILLGLSTTAVMGALRKAREEKADACVTLVTQGAAAYYVQNGKWPGPLGSQIESGTLVNTGSGEEAYALTAAEVRQTVKAMVDEARMGRPVMDISGLFVSRKSGEGKAEYGMDFMEAIRGTKKSKKKMSTSEMYFGYPEAEHGYFRRFHAYYYPKTDRLVFTK